MTVWIYKGSDGTVFLLELKDGEMLIDLMEVEDRVEWTHMGRVPGVSELWVVLNGEHIVGSLQLV